MTAKLVELGYLRHAKRSGLDQQAMLLGMRGKIRFPASR